MQFDKTSSELVRFAQGFRADALSASAAAKATEILFDSIACAVAGARSEPARIAARVAPRTQVGGSASLFGSGSPTSPEMAAFVNAVMVRAYDYNDAYYGHPSDMIPGVLAAAEVSGSSGKDVLSAVALAYEVYGAFSRGAGYHLDSGLDYGLSMNMGVALAAGKLWGLSDEQLGHAASIALLPNLPMGVARWGALSMMKGGSTAFATRNGVFAAMLAREGFTSALEPYSGIFGLQHFTGPFDLRLPLSSARCVVEMAYVKPIPAENNTIGVMEFAGRIRQWTPVEDIESIEVQLASGLDVHVADEPKYDPQTRETADHSLPFMLARALVDGGITLATYTPERIADPGIRPLMRKIRVRGNDDMKKLMKGSPVDGAEHKPAQVTVRTRSGRVLSEDILGHSGHPDTPTAVRRAVIDRKLDICGDAVGLAVEQRESIREAWWNIGEAPDVRTAIATLRGFA